MDFEHINLNDPIDITNYAIKEYYRENTTPFFSVLHPDIVFLSVGNNQLIEGRENLLKAYNNGLAHRIEDAVRYEFLTLGNHRQNVTRSICNTISQMEILTFFPTGEVMNVNQRISIMWRYFSKLEVSLDDIKTGWFAMQIHVSVGVAPVKPVSDIHHIAPSMIDKTIAAEPLLTDPSSQKYAIPDCDRYECFVRYEQIVYIDAKNLHCYVHLIDGSVINTRRSLQQFEKDLTDKGFLRIHNSHIVNGAYVERVKNYKLTLASGEVFPIPRGRFQYVKSVMKMKEDKE